MKTTQLEQRFRAENLTIKKMAHKRLSSEILRYQQLLISSRDFTPHKVGYYSQVVSDLQKQISEI